MRAICIIVLLAISLMLSPEGASGQQQGTSVTQTVGTSQTTAPPAMTDDDSAYARKKTVVDMFEAAASWYSSYGQVYQVLWIAGVVFVAATTALTSILVAMNWASAQGAGEWRRYFLASLPIAAGLVTSLLSQFHVQDSWRLRELGRIQAMAYAAEVHDLPTADDPIKMRTQLAPYRQKYYDLEREQATSFFSYLFQKTESKPDSSSQETPKLNK